MQRLMWSCLLVGVWSGTLWAYSGGTGEPNDPYLIATAQDLLSTERVHGRYFKLVADIDLDPRLPGRSVLSGPLSFYKQPRTRSFLPEGTGFAGIFDGNHYTIRNLTMVVTDRAAGLFDRLESDGIIENLHLKDVVIYGSHYPGGGLVAENAGTIWNCSISGTLTFEMLDDEVRHGALVGHNSGRIKDCDANCLVIGNLVAGVVGTNEGSVTDCSTQGTILGRVEAAGLVQDNQGFIWTCSAGGYIDAYSAGGLVGTNRGQIHSSFSTATVVGKTVGSFAVKNGPDHNYSGTALGIISHCYVQGLSYPYPYASGASHTTLIPDYFVYQNEGFIESSYLLASRVLSSNYQETPFRGKVKDCYVIGVTDDPNQWSHYIEQKRVDPNIAGNPESFPAFDFYGSQEDGQRDQWFMSGQGLPVLSWQTEESGLVAVPAVTGLTVNAAKETLEAAGFVVRVLQGNHYYAVDVDQWSWPNNYHPAYNTSYLQTLYKMYYEEYPRELIREIFMESRMVVGVQDANVVAFTRPSDVALAGSLIDVVVTPGCYDFATNPGDGSSQHPFQIQSPDQLDALSYQSGLWGAHFILTADLDMTGYPYAQSLLGTTDCSFVGHFDGGNYVIENLHLGHWQSQSSSLGLFGVLDVNAMIRRVHLNDCVVLARSDVYAASWLISGGADNVGLLVGINHGIISACTATGIVQARQYVGGLVGQNTGQISECITDTQVKGSTGVGGIVGLNTRIDSRSGDPFGTIIDCQALGTVTGESDVGKMIGLEADSNVRWPR